jgi:hypothetical protein
VLFHDINSTTAASIGTYIDEITNDVKAAGRTPEFTASAKAVIGYSSCHEDLTGFPAGLPAPRTPVTL